MAGISLKQGARWTGWVRPGSGSPWKPILQADTQAEAWRLLLNEDVGQMTVLPAGKDPNRAEGSEP
jgi:hypothetical protein